MTDKNAVRGKVIEALPSMNFNVELDDGRKVRAKLSGRMYQNRIHVGVDDFVSVVVSPDGILGRIVRRLLYS